MYRYEQHCPVARAAEIVTEPWTLLVLRELLHGSEHKADIAKGLPKISASLLGIRLQTLERHGLVARIPGNRAERRYQLTTAGRELRPLVEQLGRWGQRWLDRPRLADLDPELLVLDICRDIDRTRLPARPLTVVVDFADAPPPRRWLLTLSATAVRAHRNELLPPAAVRLTCTLGAFAGVWLGHQSWLQAVQDRAIVLAGDTAAVRSLVRCLGASRYAAVRRARETSAPAGPTHGCAR